MPTLILRRRNPHLTEKMDDPDCDPVLLANTYAQFTTINRLISGWGRVYNRWLRPRFENGARTVLDIGCGGGDVARFLSRRAARDGFDIEITGVDPDERAIAFARESDKSPRRSKNSSRRAGASNCRFLLADSHDLVASGRQFDIVLSNHLLHHLSDESLTALLKDSEALCTRLSLHNDIRRDDFAWLGFTASRLFFHRSFITEDGLMSIRRSFLPSELRPHLPSAWRIYRMPLFRTLTIYEP